MSQGTSGGKASANVTAHQKPFPPRIGCRIYSRMEERISPWGVHAPLMTLTQGTVAIISPATD